MADTGGIAQDQLRSIVARIERLEEEKTVLATDIKEVYAEAKGNGFDVKILRKIVRLRKQEQSERLEEEEITDLYMHALGMLKTPEFYLRLSGWRSPENMGKSADKSPKGRGLSAGLSCGFFSTVRLFCTELATLDVPSLLASCMREPVLFEAVRKSS